MARVVLVVVTLLVLVKVVRDRRFAVGDAIGLWSTHGVHPSDIAATLIAVWVLVVGWHVTRPTSAGADRAQARQSIPSSGHTTSENVSTRAALSGASSADSRSRSRGL